MAAEMMATLGITVDANGAISQVRVLNQSLERLSATSVASTHGMSALNALHAEAAGRVGEHSLSVTRLERVVASGTERILGMNSVLGVLGSSFLKFGVGDIYTVAILGGLYAVAKAWDAITGAARDAGKAQDEAVKAAGHMIALKAAGPGGENVLTLGQLSARRLSLESQRASVQSQLDQPAKAGDIGTFVIQAHLRERLSSLGDEIENLDGQIKITKQVIAKSVSDEDARTLKEANRAYVEAQRKAAAAALAASEEYYRHQGEVLRAARGIVADMQQNAKNYLYDSRNWARDTVNRVVADTIDANAGTFSMPSIGVNDGMTKEQVRIREKMGIFIDDANKHTDILKSAIQGTAQVIGSIIGSALNVGGGGLGSQIGGALGSGIGGGIGTKIGGGIGSIGGSFLGPVGAVVGGIIGSAIGGLFHHHKKAVDKNTDALNALTSALYNSPSGYKVAGARYRADDGRRIYEATSQEAYNRRLRGGVGSLAVAS